jgi:hypothetical protein
MLTDHFSFMRANGMSWTNAVVAARREHRAPQASGSLTALCEAWTRYTLKRAIADVIATSEHDYRAFGLDKAEILKALGQLRDDLQRGGRRGTAAAGRNRIATQLAIVVAKRRRLALGHERGGEHVRRRSSSPDLVRGSDATPTRRPPFGAVNHSRSCHEVTARSPPPN